MCPSALVLANTLLVENILLFRSSEAEWAAAELREAHRGSLRKYIPNQCKHSQKHGDYLNCEKKNVPSFIKYLR